MTNDQLYFWGEVSSIDGLPHRRSGQIGTVFAQGKYRVSILTREKKEIKYVVYFKFPRRIQTITVPNGLFIVDTTFGMSQIQWQTSFEIKVQRS